MTYLPEQLVIGFLYKDEKESKDALLVYSQATSFMGIRKDESCLRKGISDYAYFYEAYDAHQDLQRLKDNKKEFQMKINDQPFTVPADLLQIFKLNITAEAFAAKTDGPSLD